jgi:hypothetical protein
MCHSFKRPIWAVALARCRSQTQWNHNYQINGNQESDATGKITKDFLWIKTMVTKKYSHSYRATVLPCILQLISSFSSTQTLCGQRLVKEPICSCAVHRLRGRASSRRPRRLPRLVRQLSVNKNQLDDDRGKIAEIEIFWWIKTVVMKKVLT